MTTLTYNNGDKEISISDSHHLYSTPVYSTHDKNKDIPNQEVKSIDELKTFMFEIKKVTTTKATVTTTETTEPLTTEKPTEPPTEPPTPAPTDSPSPPEPIITECDIDPENRWDYYGTVEDVQSMGYSSCGHCHTW